MAEADVDEIIDEWKAYKEDKEGKAGDWKLFYNSKFGPKGKGWEHFKNAVISISDGRGWDNETNDSAQEATPGDAYPVLALYKYAQAANTKRVKILCFGYCDDSKNYGGPMKGGRKKMAYATVMTEAKESWFEGIKGPKIVQWSCESDITEAAMDEWFKEGDRL